MLPDSSAVVSVQVGVVFFAIISVFYVVLAKNAAVSRVPILTRLPNNRRKTHSLLLYHEQIVF